MKTITNYDIETLSEKHVAKILKSVAKYYPDYELSLYTPCSENEADVRIEHEHLIPSMGKFYTYYAATSWAPKELKGNPQYKQDSLNASITVHDVDTMLLQKIVNRATNRKNGVRGTIFFENGVATLFFSIFYPTYITR